MKRLLISTITLTALAWAQDPSAADREKAIRYLHETRSGVQAAAKGLSEAQWNYKPGPNRWSVAEVVEHLALIEDILKTVFTKFPEGPAPAADRETAAFDADLVAKIVDRSQKVEAPPQARPAARWTPAGALE